jgi:hypothetical protein
VNLEIRHMPVTANRTVVGMVSLRDLFVTESLA